MITRFTLFLCLTLICVPSLGTAATLEVGAGQTYTTIGTAVTAASAGDTINVHAGTYDEKVLIQKSLTIRNNTGDSPIIHPTTSGYPIKVDTTSNVSITGFGITGWSGNFTAGIRVDTTDGITITNNVIHDSTGTSNYGMYVRNSTRITITGNDVYNCSETGIEVLSAHSTNGTYANGTLIQSNTVHDNAVDGMDIHGQYVIVELNQILDNITTDYAATHPDGIALVAATLDGYDGTNHIIIRRNVIRNHSQNVFIEGLASTHSASDINVYDNILYNTSTVVHGVTMDSIGSKAIELSQAGGSGGVFVYNNTIGRHGTTAVDVNDCTAASIYIQNNIVNNTLSSGVGIRSNATASITALDYNLYYTPGTDPISWGGTFYASAAAFHAAQPSWETHAVDGDPLINTFRPRHSKSTLRHSRLARTLEAPTPLTTMELYARQLRRGTSVPTWRRPTPSPSPAA